MNTHQKYQTINHIHFDFGYVDGNSWGYPQSELLLVECADGHWFVEQASGDEYSRFPGVVKSAYDLETMPTFYPDVDSAAKAAFALIKQVYPTTPDKHLADFLANN